MRLALWLWGRVYFVWKRNRFAWGAYRTRNIYEMFVARTHLLGTFRPGFAEPCGLGSCSCISRSLDVCCQGTHSGEWEKRGALGWEEKAQTAEGGISTRTARNLSATTATQPSSEIQGQLWRQGLICAHIRIQPSQSTVVNYLKSPFHT